MKVYNKKLLENTFLVEEAKILRNGKFINPDQFFKIKNTFEQLKTQPNYLIRIGFFLLGMLLYASICGALSLITLPLHDNANFDFAVFIYGYAVVGFIGSELLTRNNHYNFGLDDAFILIFQLQLFTAIGFSSDNRLAVAVAMAIIGSLACLRYVNTLSGFVALLGVTGTVGFLVVDYGIFPTVFLPFVMLLLAMLLYWIFTILNKKTEAYFYQYPLQLLQVFALILGYASVNYLVVRELSVELLGIEVAPGADIPFAFVFYFLTFAFPVGYVIFALLKKKREFLIVGLLAFAFSVYTIRHYYSVMPIETALILGGIFLFAVAYFGIVKLRHKERGLTFEPDRHTDKNALLHAQALIINSQLQQHPMPTEDPMGFGGGGFSGGGAGETY